MRARDTLSSLALPLIGAAALTAGALLIQIARRPPSQAGSEAPSADGSGPQATAGHGDRASGAVAFQKNESLLRRLRKRGL